jgi:hypothetical protein
MIIVDMVTCTEPHDFRHEHTRKPENVEFNQNTHFKNNLRIKPETRPKIKRGPVKAQHNGNRNDHGRNEATLDNDLELDRFRGGDPSMMVTQGAAKASRTASECSRNTAQPKGAF